MGTFEAVGAAGFAQPAVEAGLHFGQFRSPILVHVLLPRGAAQQLRKPADGVQLNPLGAGHAVAAAAAEVAGQLLPVLGDDRLQLRGEGDFPLGAVQELGQFLFFLHPPDGDRVVKLLEEGICRLRRGEQPAGEGLHGDEAQVQLFAQGDEVDVLLGGDVGHRELDGIVKAALSRFLRDGPAVGSDADEPAFALALGLQQALVQAVFILRVGNRLDVVQLHDVHIIGAEHAKALVQIL